MKKIRRATYHKFWKNRKRWQRGVLISILVLSLLSSSLYYWLFWDLPSVQSLEDGYVLPSTRIYDRHGRLLYEIVDLYGGSHHTVGLNEMASCMSDATIATEDANF